MILRSGQGAQPGVSCSFPRYCSSLVVLIGHSESLEDFSFYARLSKVQMVKVTGDRAAVPGLG